MVTDSNRRCGMTRDPIYRALDVTRLVRSEPQLLNRLQEVVHGHAE